MEFAAAALTTIAGSGSLAGSSLGSAAAAGAAGAGAGGSLLASLGSTSMWASILAGGATVASVLANQRAGQTQAFSYEMAANDAELETKIEEVQGIERRTSLKAALVQALGDRDVATAASGVDLSFGTPTVARSEAIKDTERALSSDQATEEFRVARLRERASNYRMMAAQSRGGTLAKSAGIALEGAGRVIRRG